MRINFGFGSTNAGSCRALPRPQSIVAVIVGVTLIQLLAGLPAMARAIVVVTAGDTLHCLGAMYDDNNFKSWYPQARASTESGVMGSCTDSHAIGGTAAVLSYQVGGAGGDSIRMPCVFHAGDNYYFCCPGGSIYHHPTTPSDNRRCQ